jgi:glycosyltransferase involved in cell wall biosynthesis
MSIDISVCMITYNHSKYVKNAIQGILLQNCDLRIELVISDDCSTDDTVEIIKNELINAPSNFVINFIRRKVNVGVNENFISALYSCTGKYIAICEGDDYWCDPNKILIQFRFLSNNNSFIMSFHDGYIVNNLMVTDKMILNNSTKKDINFTDLVTIGYTIPTLTVFFRNCINNKLPDEMFKVTNCDSFLFLFLTQFGNAHFHNDITDVFHVYHQGGIWSMKSKLERSLKSYHTYYLAFKYFKDKRIIYLLNNFANSIIIYSIKSKKFNIAIKYYLKNLVNIFINPNIFSLFFKKQLNYFLSFIN